MSPTSSKPADLVLEGQIGVEISKILVLIFEKINPLEFYLHI